MRAAVVIPSVNERADYRADTLNQLHARGFNDIVVELTPPNVQRGSHGQGVTARRGIARALELGAEYVLHLEDDVMLSEYMTPAALDKLANQDVVTLYLASGQKFYAQAPTAGAWLCPVREQSHWYSCQALLFPRDVAEYVVGLNENTIRALDYEIRALLAAAKMPLYVLLPNLVQHRAPASVGPDDTSNHTSDSFQ